MFNVQQAPIKTHLARPFVLPVNLANILFQPVQPVFFVILVASLRSQALHSVWIVSLAKLARILAVLAAPRVLQAAMLHQQAAALVKDALRASILWQLMALVLTALRAATPCLQPAPASPALLVLHSLLMALRVASPVERAASPMCHVPLLASVAAQERMPTPRVALSVIPASQERLAQQPLRQERGLHRVSLALSAIILPVLQRSVCHVRLVLPATKLDAASVFCALLGALWSLLAPRFAKIVSKATI